MDHTGGTVCLEETVNGKAKEVAVEEESERGCWLDQWLYWYGIELGMGLWLIAMQAGMWLIAM